LHIPLDFPHHYSIYPRGDWLAVADEL
jgi:hypothetical protein